MFEVNRWVMSLLDLVAVVSTLAVFRARGVKSGGLVAAAARHREAGLRGASSTHYAGSHWLGSFATYLVTGRGLA